MSVSLFSWGGGEGGDAAFPRVFCTIAVSSLYGEYVVRFSSGRFFRPCDHGLDFDSKAENK